MLNEFLQIRPYVEADEGQVVELWTAAFPDAAKWNIPQDDIRRKLSVQRDLFLVGVSDRRVVATVMAGFDGCRGWIHRLAVESECRHRGYGRCMMDAAELGLRNIGCPKVNLQVLPSNDAVVAFYERIGYVIEDRISMSKRLP